MTHEKPAGRALARLQLGTAARHWGWSARSVTTQNSTLPEERRPEHARVDATLTWTMPQYPVAAGDVHATLGRHILTVGHSFVLDLERSHGPFVHDAKSGQEFLDFASFYASNPLGFAAPCPHADRRVSKSGCCAPRSLKVANPDFYTTYLAEFVETLSRARLLPPAHPHYFFVEGGSLADRERHEGGVRLEGTRINQAPGPRRAGQPDPALRAGVSRSLRLLAQRHQHGSGQDAAFSRSFLGRACRARSCASRKNERRQSDEVRELEAPHAGQGRASFFDIHGARHRRHLDRADSGRRRRQPFSTGVLAGSAAAWPTSGARCSSSTRYRPAWA